MALLALLAFTIPVLLMALSATLAFMIPVSLIALMATLAFTINVLVTALLVRQEFISITIEGIFIIILFTICSKKCLFKRAISINHLRQQIIDLRKCGFVGYKFIYIL
jgi:hypothetical protein